MFTYEADHFGKNNDFSHYHNLNFSYHKHLHRSYEFMYVKSGKIEVNINNRTFLLKSNECILILPYEVHSFVSKDNSDSDICVFSPQYIKTFDDMIHEKYLNNPVFTLSESTKNLVMNSLFKDNNDILQMKGCLYLICSELLNSTSIKNDLKLEINDLHKVLNYIQENFTNNISLKSIAKKFGYSYTYLSKYLNKILGMSFVDFVNENKINYSLYLLKSTNAPITDIAYTCGYSSIRSFNRNFYKITNTTPKEFRKSVAIDNGKLTIDN